MLTAVFYPQSWQKTRKKMSEIGFLALFCLLLAAVVSAPPTGAKTKKKSFLNILPSPDQTDGSGIQLLNEDWGEMVLRAGQDGWMDGRMNDSQTGIVWCKSPLMEHCDICCFLITRNVSEQNEDRWKDVISHVMLSESKEEELGGEGSPLFLLLRVFSSKVSLLVDPNPHCSCEWG